MSSQLLHLAQQFALSKGTSIISHRMDGAEIIFVLESGMKIRATEARLKELLTPEKQEESPPEIPEAKITPPIQKEPTRKKGEKK
jgi:hypothetical protein